MAKSKTAKAAAHKTQQAPTKKPSDKSVPVADASHSVNVRGREDMHGTTSNGVDGSQC